MAKVNPIYRKRAKLKRWLQERDEYQTELEEKLAYVAEHGHYWGRGSVEYPQTKIKELTEKIAELSKEDLRTDAEKRGHQWKEYTRKKHIDYRGWTDEEIEAWHAKWRRSQKAADEIHERELATPGSRLRQMNYDIDREGLLTRIKDLKVNDLLARRAVTEKRGEAYSLSEDGRDRIEQYKALLADLNDLDHEYDDCNPIGLWSRINDLNDD